MQYDLQKQDNSFWINMKKEPLSRSEIMSHVKGKDTAIEIKLRKALWQKGFRYRKNCKDIFGKPDICFKTKKVAIFCDSEFWHGKSYLEGKGVPKTNSEYWMEKFNKNINRDIAVTKQLQDDGWTVLRFWENDINKDLDFCISKIVNILQASQV